MNLKNFNLYTADDFIMDEEFIDIVRNSDSSDQLKELLESLPEKRDEINLAVQVLHGLSVGKFHQPFQMKQKFWQSIVQTQKREIRMRWIRIAASLLLFIGSGSAIYYLAIPEKVKFVAAVNEPSPNNATLILANGKKVSIISKQSTIHYSADGSGIVINDSANIAQSIKENELNQLIVPYGKRSYIQLSEGTKVWLNSGSKLRFPPIFKGNTREVYLEGEAYFDVTKNEGKPFFVKTDLFKIKVYGTKFNVQAYQEDNDYNIVLVEGKVGMNANENTPSGEVFLVPSQRATMSKGKGQFMITNVESTDFYTAWVDGYLTFRDEEVTDLLKRVSRYYNITIETDLLGKVEKIYGKLDLKDDLKRVLDGIAFISKTKYEMRGNKYIFSNPK